MKILLYMPGILFDGDTGDATHVRQLAENLSKLGNEITVIATAKNRACDTNVTLKAIKHLKVRLFDAIFSLIGGLFLGAVTIIRWKPDLLYKRDTLLAHSYILTKLFKCPSITEVNGFLSDEISLLAPQDLLVRLSSPIALRMGKKSLKSANHIIAVTPLLESLLHSEYGIELSKITVVPNGADIDLFQPLDTHSARAELRLAQKYKYVCFVGTLEPWQGVGNLIKSLPLILEKCPDTHFLIVGDGIMRTEWVNLVKQLDISDEVIFTGSIPHQRVPLYINASDICVVPKVPIKSGYSPLKLYEYMACGKPVVATRTDGFEILEKHNAGLLVNPTETQELTDAIITLLQDKELRKQMGKNGRRYVVKNHSWQSTATKVAEVCEDVVSKSRPKNKA